MMFRRAALFSVLLWMFPLSSWPVAAGVNPLQALQAEAAAGDPWAQLNLGAAYDNALLGLDRDPALAASWYRLAARQGLAEAQFNLGHLLVSESPAGDGLAEARHWLAEAARQGLAEAQYLYAVMLLQGVGGEIDLATAHHWLQQAADAGFTPAAELLGQSTDDPAGTAGASGAERE